MAKRPRVAVFKFASCDGCQLTLLDCEDELLAVNEKVEFVHFLEAADRRDPGPYDIALVEGSITTPGDVERIREVRRQAKFLVTIGACATSGGIQALRNWADHADFLRAVYASPQYIESLATSTAIAEHVPVDFELRGCPIDKRQLLEVIRSLVAGRRPRTPSHSVCLDCKRRGTVCVMVAGGIPCLGPVTQSGCGAICPAYDRGCYACFGPVAQPNVVSLTNQFQRDGRETSEIVQGLRLFNAWAPEFRAESDRLDSSLAIRTEPAS
jgi:coenzyme F420-reducing hydrogenase gamma subunit